MNEMLLSWASLGANGSKNRTMSGVVKVQLVAVQVLTVVEPSGSAVPLMTSAGADKVVGNWISPLIVGLIQPVGRSVREPGVRPGVKAAVVSWS